MVMSRDIKRTILYVTAYAVVGTLCLGQAVFADQYSSTNYQIDASVMNSFGGTSSSTSYQMVSSGGESIIGNGSSGSYILGQGYVAQLEKSLQLSVQPTGLVGHWALNELSGSLVYDSSASSNHGNTVNSSTWTTGKLAGAASFNGSSQYITLADIDLPTNITVEAWVYPTSTQSSKVISKFSTTSDTQGNIALASNVPSFSITTGGTIRNPTGGSALPNNAWSHVVGVYDGTTAKLYVNGSEADSVGATGAIAANNFVWTLGRDADGSSNYFAGHLDNVKIFSTALTASQVAEEYRAQNMGISSGLSLGTVVPGISNTSMFSAIIATDAGSYDLYVQQNQNMTSGAYTIPAISGSIASPASWTEGTTKGLGFTLVSTNATAIPGKWSSGNAYAAFPATSTLLYSRTGVQSVKDTLDMRLRLDTAITQQSGTYNNTITFTGTIKP
ncbi:LamG domain-containing protein [Candidatus Saccharibacteria bacterium]|nr:LamG domain-containing protein [Candidatus Saccharibacteria bacterium]